MTRVQFQFAAAGTLAERPPGGSGQVKSEGLPVEEPLTWSGKSVKNRGRRAR